LIGALVLAALACGPSGEPAASDAISAQELLTRLEAGSSPMVLDVRTAEEFGSGHIPGAVNIPHTELAERIDEIGPDRSSEIVVHCERGRRAGIADGLLSDAGFTTVRDLDGHMSGWREAGHPVE
jgi:hydroxyacylglutathione hydrolase